MSTPPRRAVVDASVAVKLFVPENLSAEAHAVFKGYAAGQSAELIVPGLFFAECANVFWKWVQRHAYPAKSAVGHLRDLELLGLTVVPTQAVAAAALDAALRYRITAYDACYATTAAQLGLPLITADRKLMDALTESPFDIEWLGDVDVTG